MRLIGLAVVLAGSILLAPLAAEAQKSEKMARVGILGLGPVPSPQDLAKSVSTNPFWISMRELGWVDGQNMVVERRFGHRPNRAPSSRSRTDRKSTRLNSSHLVISYAVFCLKKKKI